MNLALDTNTYTDLMRGDSSVISKVNAAEIVVLPFAVLGEVMFGAYHGRKFSGNMADLDNFMSEPGTKILHANDLTADIFGQISSELRKKGKQIQHNDIWIAALCRQHNLVLLTSDRGFENIDGIRIDWHSKA